MANANGICFKFDMSATMQSWFCLVLEASVEVLLIAQAATIEAGSSKMSTNVLPSCACSLAQLSPDLYSKCGCTRMLQLWDSCHLPWCKVVPGTDRAERKN